MDVFFRGFHGKTSSPLKIELVYLFYTFARRLYDTWNCELHFQNRTSTTQSMHQVVLDVISFAYCQLTVALISLKLFPFVQCMRFKVVCYLVLTYEFLNKTIYSRTHALVRLIFALISQLHLAAIIIQYKILADSVPTFHTRLATLLSRLCFICT